MTNNEPINMTATNERRVADLRATPAPIMPNRLTRRDIVRTRRHSVSHRAIR